MPKKPFTPEIITVYADRLVRHGLLLRALGDPSHPVMVAEDLLLADAEGPVRASANYCRRDPAWPVLKSWFASKVMEVARERLSYYEFPPFVGNSVLASIVARGFDHLLERQSGESGVRPSPGSNVMSSGQCRTS